MDTCGYEPEYGDRLSTHLPMLVEALARLGGSSQRVDELSVAYAKRLTPLTDGDAARAVDWQRVLGARSDFTALFRYFRDEVARLGIEATVQRYLPELMPGVAGAAFHPLITLYYAVSADSPRGVAYALAYSVFAFLQLPVPARDESPMKSLTELSLQLGALPRTQPKPGLLFDALLEQSKRAEVARVIDAVDPNTNLTQALEFACRVHWRSNSLLSLHMVTSVHAYWRLLELTGFEATAGAVSATRARRDLLVALLVAYVTCQCPTLIAVPESPADWSPTLARARVATDEHVIKLTYTCWDADARWQVPATRALAERAVQPA